MRIGIVGGTGKEGAGLGAPLGAGRARGDHRLARRGARARQGRRAGRVARRARASAACRNRDAVAAAEIVVLTVPADGLAATLPERARRLPRQDRRQHGRARSPSAAAASSRRRRRAPSAEEAQEILGPEARVVAAFHHIAAHELAAGEHDIECDLLLCGGDADAKTHRHRAGHVDGTARDRRGRARPTPGPLEGITAVLATINRRYKLKNSGIKITGLP